MLAASHLKILSKLFYSKCVMLSLISSSTGFNFCKHKFDIRYINPP